MHDTSIAVNRLSHTLNSVVDQHATLQIQTSAVGEVNTQLKSKIATIEEKFKKMQDQIDTKHTPAFASVAGSGPPPRPNVDLPPRKT
jgi:chromosome segregation ATPase